MASGEGSLPAIRSVLAAYRSTEAHITEEQITAAWAEYDALGQITDEMVERARLAQGRRCLGRKYQTSQDPEDIETALFYAIPPEQMRAALEAVTPS